MYTFLIAFFMLFASLIYMYFLITVYSGVYKHVLKLAVLNLFSEMRKGMHMLTFFQIKEGSILSVVHKFSDRFAGQLSLVEEPLCLISVGEWARRDFQFLNKPF